MPPTITFEQATGFGIFMPKAVLSGRGDEIVDLAKVNLFRHAGNDSEARLIRGRYRVKGVYVLATAPRAREQR